MKSINLESAPKSPINWILSGVEGCKHLLIRTLRLRSVSGFPLNCLFGVDSIFKSPNLQIINYMFAIALDMIMSCISLVPS